MCACLHKTFISACSPMSNNVTAPWAQRLFQRYVTWSSDADADEAGSRHSNEQREIPAMPTLPTDRAHQLELAPEAGHEPGSNSSAFFQRLPPDVRRLILIEAFGKRTMHVDLQYRPTRSDAGSFGIISGLQSALSGVFYFYGRQQQQQQQQQADGRQTPCSSWQWRGFVCHRDPKRRARGRKYMCRTGDSRLMPGGHNHKTQACDGWPGEKSLKCRVGAMGWLRTCRQA